jgi:hypothetical protein
MSRETADAGGFDCRQAFAEELSALAQADPRIVAVCNDSVGSSNLVGFRKTFPDRVINVGIAEQNMVGVAAGLANGGYLPFVCAAAPFLTGRALEQIKADVVYSGVPVVLCGMSPGLAYGELGPTHHSIEDLAWMRAIDDLPVVVPADPDETRAAMRWAAAYGRPRGDAAAGAGRDDRRDRHDGVTCARCGHPIGAAGHRCAGDQCRFGEAAGRGDAACGSARNRWHRHGGRGHGAWRARLSGG